VTLSNLAPSFSASALSASAFTCDMTPAGLLRWYRRPCSTGGTATQVAWRRAPRIAAIGASTRATDNRRARQIRRTGAQRRARVR
jgi:hypothetical protein